MKHPYETECTHSNHIVNFSVRAYSVAHSPSSLYLNLLPKMHRTCAMLCINSGI